MVCKKVDDAYFEGVSNRISEAAEQEEIEYEKVFIYSTKMESMANRYTLALLSFILHLVGDLLFLLRLPHYSPYCLSLYIFM